MKSLGSTKGGGLSFGSSAPRMCGHNRCSYSRHVCGAKDPLSPLTSAKGSILYFRRDYSAEHLMQHPKQTTRSVLLAFQEQGLVTIFLSQRMGAQNRILAGCGWREGAGRHLRPQDDPQFQQASGIRLHRNGRGFG